MELVRIYTCTSKLHTRNSECPYPKDQIPERWMRADPQILTGRIFKSCWYCREKDRVRKEKNEKAKLEKKENPESETISSNVARCLSNFHRKRLEFPFHFYEVPEKWLRDDPSNTESEILKICWCCRHIDENSIEIKSVNGKTYCCSSVIHTPYRNFPFLKNSVPEKWMRQEPQYSNSKILKTCWFCRSKDGTYRGGKNIKKEKQEDLEEDISPLKIKGLHSCVSNHHYPINNPIYPKMLVPEKWMRKNPEDEKSEILKQCWQCRQIDKITCKEYNDRFKEHAAKQKELVLEGKSDIMYCPCKHHGNSVYSEYSRHEVPIDNFRKEPGDPHSGFFEYCIDCRTVNNYKCRTDHNIKLSNAGDRLLCYNCLKDITYGGAFVKEDGSKSKRCIDCREYNMKHKAARKEVFKRIKLELIEKHETSCQRCKCLYFKPVSEDSLVVFRLDTYTKEGPERYVNFNGIEYKAKEMIEKAKYLLELSIIDMDHLTMKEQLERGIIKSENEFIPKKQNISTIHSEHAIRLEARKCQHLCRMCHVIVTISREIGETRHQGVRGQKQRYVNSLKINGCVSCGYKNEDVPRLFDMDHIETKSIEISRMIMSSAYSLNDIIEECKKCQVLCKHCHIVKTIRQMATKNFPVKDK